MDVELQVEPGALLWAELTGARMVKWSTCACELGGGRGGGGRSGWRRKCRCRSTGRLREAFDHGRLWEVESKRIIVAHVYGGRERVGWLAEEAATQLGVTWRWGDWLESWGAPATVTVVYEAATPP